MKNTYSRRIFHIGLLTLTGALLSACVTINIYFPAAAAEQAADKIIGEVWQLQKGEGGKDKAAPAPSTTPTQSQPQPQK